MWQCHTTEQDTFTGISGLKVLVGFQRQKITGGLRRGQGAKLPEFKGPRPFTPSCSLEGDPSSVSSFLKALILTALHLP